MESRPRITAHLGLASLNAPTAVIAIAEDGKALEVVSADDFAIQAKHAGTDGDVIVIGADGDPVTRGLKHVLEVERNRPSYGAPRVLLADSPRSHHEVIAERIAERNALAVVHVEQPRRSMAKSVGMLAAMAAMGGGVPFDHQLPRGARRSSGMPNIMPGIAGRSTIGDNPAGTTDPELRAARIERRRRRKKLRAHRGRK